MTDDATPVEPAVRRCPACGAVRPPSAQWCLQCYTAFDPPQPALGPQEPQRPAVPEPSEVPPPLDEPDGPAEQAQGDPVHEAPAGAGERDDLDARAEEMLQRLAREGGASPVGRLGGLSSGRGSKVALAIGGAVALTLVLVALMAGVGVLL